MLIIDSKTVKNNYGVGANLGFDGNKKIKGFKLQLVVDTLGFLYGTFIHAANDHDSPQGINAIKNINQNILKNIKKIIGDKGYRKTFIEDCKKLNLEVEIANNGKNTGIQGFNLDPKRWIVERTIAWLTRCRRLVVNYEKSIKSYDCFVWIAMMHLGIKKLFSFT